MKKILVVDDNYDILEPLSLLLESFGYDVAVITRGEEALSITKSMRPNLILLDILMSGVDGRDICKKLKTDTATQKIPVVMMSAHPFLEKTISKCYADGFLEKPFETEKLLELIKKNIGD